MRDGATPSGVISDSGYGVTNQFTVLSGSASTKAETSQQPVANRRKAMAALQSFQPSPRGSLLWEVPWTDVSDCAMRRLKAEETRGAGVELPAGHSAAYGIAQFLLVSDPEKYVGILINAFSTKGNVPKEIRDRRPPKGTESDWVIAQTLLHTKTFKKSKGDDCVVDWMRTTKKFKHAATIPVGSAENPQRKASLSSGTTLDSINRIWLQNRESCQVMIRVRPNARSKILAKGIKDATVAAKDCLDKLENLSDLFFYQRKAFDAKYGWRTTQKLKKQIDSHANLAAGYWPSCVGSHQEARDQGNNADGRDERREPWHRWQKPLLSFCGGGIYSRNRGVVGEGKGCIENIYERFHQFLMIMMTPTSKQSERDFMRENYYAFTSALTPLVVPDANKGLIKEAYFVLASYISEAEGVYCFDTFDTSAGGKRRWRISAQEFANNIDTVFLLSTDKSLVRRVP